MSAELIIRSILLGAGLAMDAFSVSLADGLSENRLGTGRVLAIAGTFAAFQFFMPMTGWALVRSAAERFAVLQRFIPWIALALLVYIGGGMLAEGIRERTGGSGDVSAQRGGTGHLKPQEIFMQGVATSIDALSVGFTIESYALDTALASSLIIGAVTLVICIAGLLAGRQIGTRLSGGASVLGGIILIAIGIEIWMKGVFF